MSTVLIVDDHAAVRVAVRQLFESSVPSVVCHEAANGGEAIVKAHELKPDLIVLDLSMPVMNGFDAAEVLRHLFPTVPIIMLTDHFMEATKQAALRVGIRAIFSKHDDLTPFLAQARTLLTTQSAPISK